MDSLDGISPISRGSIGYDKLANPRKRLRLINLEDSETSTQIPTVSISTVTIWDAPPYHAISYTWGESTSKEPVHVTSWQEGRATAAGLLSVQVNCADVLRQLKHFSTSKYYWIDAICINQSDNEEKECQVAMMDRIFMHAECVLACVGMHLEQDDSQFLTTTLRDFEMYLDNAGLSSSILTSGVAVTKRSPEARARRRCLQAWRRWIESMPDAAFERFYRALDQLAWRPYFWRIWILQELYLAKNVRVLCGFDEINLSTLLLWWRESKVQLSAGYDVATRQEDYDSDTRPFFMDKFGPDYFENALWINNRFFAERGGSLLGIDFEDMLCQRLKPRLSEASIPYLPMNKLLDLCKYRRCKDRRDCVYGTLAIGRWTLGPSYLPDGTVSGSGSVVAPDYTKSVFDLAMDLMPNFHSDLQISELVIGALAITHTDPWVQRGLELRRGLHSAKDDMGYWQRSEDEQSFVQLVHPGVQLGIQTTWAPAPTTVGPRRYTRIVDNESRCRAIATSDVKAGDWLLPTHFGRGLVLRKIGTYYAIIGKAWCPPKNVPEDMKMTAFMMWYDTEDLLVHLTGGLQGFADYSIDRPSEQLVEQLHINVCGTANSSFAQISGQQRHFPAVEYREYSQAIWETLLYDWQEALGIVPELDT